MTSITMDPPHVVHTGVACTACCSVAPGKLLRCSACDSAWYCNQDCQRQHFKEHKPFCRALRLFHAFQADLPLEAWPRGAHDFYVQRTNCQQILEPMLRRPLSRSELRAILGEPKCSVCMRTRIQLARRPATVAAAAAGAVPHAAGAPNGTSGSPASGGANAAAVLAASGAATANGGGSEPTATTPVAANGDAAGAGGSTAAAPSSLDVRASSEAVADGYGAKGGAAARQPAGSVASAAVGAAPATTAPPCEHATRPPEGAATTAAAPSLSCCPHCYWGWVCSEHRDAYLSGPHAAVCLPYQQMNDSQLLTYRYLTATGRLPNYVPDQLRPVGQSGAQAGGWEPVPAGWEAFQGWRPLPSFDHAMMGLLTKRMSQALTVVQAMQHQYTRQHLAAKGHLEVHVLGASAFEVPADRIWEEILNLLPPWDPTAAPAAKAEGPTLEEVAPPTEASCDGTSSGPRVLHVAFVGPELRDIIVEESDGRALPQGTSLSMSPPPPGRELLYSYHLCTYQEFARGRRTSTAACGGGGAAVGMECLWRRPDLAVAFNSGVSETEKGLWAPALEVLIRHNVPVVFTSYNAEEAAADAAVWRAAGGEVTLGPERNPFQALEPISEPSMVDAFYYQNYYWWCGRASVAAQ